MSLGDVQLFRVSPIFLGLFQVIMANPEPASITSATRNDIGGASKEVARDDVFSDPK